MVSPLVVARVCPSGNGYRCSRSTMRAPRPTARGCTASSATPISSGTVACRLMVAADATSTSTGRTRCKSGVIALGPHPDHLAKSAVNGAAAGRHPGQERLIQLTERKRPAQRPHVRFGGCAGYVRAVDGRCAGFA